MIRYLYIDDENVDTTAPIRDGLRDTGLIEVELEQPQSFENQTLDLVSKLKNFDGVILDLRLDDNHSSKARYTAPPLAQYLRTNAVINKEGKDCPIILCSTDDKIKKSYMSDRSSHDLFDYKFLKDHKPEWTKIATKLAALAKGYQCIQERKLDFSKILYRDVTELDARISNQFLVGDFSYPINEYARFIVKELLGQPGPLINEKLLSAKLGVDINNSKDDWRTLVDSVLGAAKYVGAFSDGWTRWWIDRIILEFKKFSGGKRLSSLKAHERVEILIKATGLGNLRPAEPINLGVSTNYWTICEYYKRPLDPLEGFKIATSKELRPWQDPRYLSLEASLERRGYENGLRVHPSEEARLDVIKAQIRENKSR
jgi:hypothetical protein